MGRGRYLPCALSAILLSAGYACATAGPPPAAPPAPKDLPISISQVYPRTGFAPLHFWALVRVSPHADNRALCVGVSLHEFVVRRSCEQLEGERAAKLYELRWREPLYESGTYTVFAQLYRLDKDKPYAVTRTELPVLSAHGLTLVARLER